METTQQMITVQTRVQAPVEKAWGYFTRPEHITRWYFATEEWHAPYAENDLRPGGRFRTTMAAKDGSFSFDFGGRYDEIELHKKIAFTLGDGRKVIVSFEADGEQTSVSESFDPEQSNSAAMQKAGWQAILDQFKKYVERS